MSTDELRKIRERDEWSRRGPGALIYQTRPEDSYEQAVEDRRALLKELALIAAERDRYREAADEYLALRAALAPGTAVDVE